MAAIGDSSVVRHAGTDAAPAATRTTTAVDAANGSHPKLATDEQPDAAEERDRSHRHACQRQLQAAAEDERHEIAV